MNEEFDPTLAKMIDEVDSPDGLDKARLYRLDVKTAVDAAVERQETPAFQTVDGEVYISVEMISVIAGVLAQRGMQAALAGSLGIKDADGALAAYSESATLLDVLSCVAKDIPVV